MPQHAMDFQDGKGVLKYLWISRRDGVEGKRRQRSKKALERPDITTKLRLFLPSRMYKDKMDPAQALVFSREFSVRYERDFLNSKTLDTTSCPVTDY